MNQHIKVIAIFLYMVFNTACNLEINTVDPQASININDSKKDGLLISEYQSQEIPNFFDIKEAWVEHVWFNKLSNGKTVKLKSSEIQLNLKLSDFLNPEFKEDKYIIRWAMKDKKNNFLGKSNGVYVMDLDNQKIMDSIYISICKINQDETTTEVYRFLIRRKNN